MHLANAVIHHSSLGIRWTKADGLLHKQDYFVNGPSHQPRCEIAGGASRRDPDRARSWRPGFRLHSARVDDAGEFRQHAVAGGLDDPPVMLADLRIDEFDEMRFDTFVRAFLARAHQARIAYHIGGKDRGETVGGGRGGHCSGARLFSCVRAFKWDRLSPRKN